MNAPKNTIALKILIVILGLLVLGLGGYTYTVHQQVRHSENKLKKEKELLLKNLNNEIEKYNVMLAQKNNLMDELKVAKNKLHLLEAHLKKAKATRAMVYEYQRTLGQLKEQLALSMKNNDSLVLENNRLSQKSLDTEKLLAAQLQSQDSLMARNQFLEQKVIEGEKIAVSALSARGVIQRNSGKLVPTTRAIRAKMIQVCFSVNKNLLANQGEKLFYTQVLDQEGTLIGVKKEVVFEGRNRLNYSVRTRVAYNNEAVSVCELVKPTNNLEAGKYTINLFFEDTLLSTQQFLLK